MKDETIRNNVIEILKKYPQTRNDDNLLVIRLLLKLGYAKKRLNEIKINLLEFENFPAFESITRIRRELQNNEKLYLPDEETSEKRDKSETEYKQKYSKREVSPETMENSQMMF